MSPLVESTNATKGCFSGVSHSATVATDSSCAEKKAQVWTESTSSPSPGILDSFHEFYSNMNLCSMYTDERESAETTDFDVDNTDNDSVLFEGNGQDDDMSLWSGYQTHNLSFETEHDSTFSMADLLSFPGKPNSSGNATANPNKNSPQRAPAPETSKADQRDDSIPSNSPPLPLAPRQSGKGQSSDKMTPQKWSHKGEAHYAKKEFDAALNCFESARFAYAVTLGEDALPTIDATIRMGVIQLSNQSPESALTLFQNARNMITHVEAGKQADLQAAYLSEEISSIQKSKGQLPEALKQMKCALRLYKNHYGEVHLKVAKSAAEIANLYSLTGERPKALAVYTQVLKIQVGLFGKLHPDVADTLFELALLHDEMGDADRSMKITKKAYLIYNATVGENTLAVTRVLSHFGNLYFKLDKRMKAFKAYGRALHIRKALLGRNHQLVADTLMDIGSLLRSQGQTQQAMQCMMEALDIYKRCYGAKNVAVSDVMNVIGMTYYDQGDCDNAIKMYTQVLNIRVNQLGENHPAVANVLNNIGTVYSKKKDFDNALRSYSTALRIYEKHETRDHLKYAVTLVNIGTVMKSKGENEKAKDAFKHALEICYEDAMLKADHPVVIKATKGLDALSSSSSPGNMLGADAIMYNRASV